MLVYIMVALLNAATAGVAMFELQHAQTIRAELQGWHEIVLNIERFKFRWTDWEAALAEGWDLKKDLVQQFHLLNQVSTGPDHVTGTNTLAGQYPLADAVRKVLADAYQAYDRWERLPIAERPQQADQVGGALSQLSNQLQSELGKINQSANAQSTRARILLSLVLLLTLLHIAAIGAMLKRWLLRPLETLNRQVVALGRDEAADEPLLTAPPELAALATALDGARQSLGTARRQLLDAERLTTIGQMAAQLAHNLRNPLASIRAAAQLTSRHHQSADPVPQRMADIIGSVDRLNRWVLGLMEVARRDPTLTRDIDVVPTVQRAIDGVQEELAAKELRLSFDAPAAGMICAHDPTTLEHALIAMLVNAVEASPLGGQLHVEVASVEMPSGSEMMSESLCRISIRDHGRGFPVDHLERIFEFSFTTKQSGMGLGLALARQSLKRQGGNTGASNHPDGGAVVTIELPIRPSLADDVGLSTDIEPSTSIESVNMVRSDERM